MGARKEEISEGMEEEDEDNVPIAFSRGKLAKKRDGNGKEKPGLRNGNSSFKVKKEEYSDGELDGKLPKKELSAKKSTPMNSARVKKEEPTEETSSSEEEDDDGKVSKKNIKKSAVKKKIDQKKKIEKKAKSVENGKNKRKNVFDLPGQKHDHPEERDPLRIFYETLYQQLPNSEMAQFWMMEYGLLPRETAQKIYEKKLRKSNNQMKQSTPVISASSNRNADSGKKTKPMSAGKTAAKSTAKRKLGTLASDDDDYDDDDDFIASKKKPKKQKTG